MKGTFVITLFLFIGMGSICVPTFGQAKRTTKGLIEEKIVWQGLERNYLVHLPSEHWTKKPLPVLFVLHGGGGTAKGTVKVVYGRFNALSDEHGFIVIYPNAIKKNWNDGRKSNLKRKQKNVDDVGFIAEIIKSLTEKYKVDQSRIFTAGMSNGGFMSSRLLCDRADLFRGGAILTATLSSDYLPECNPAKPIAVLIMNGTSDPIVPYGGGEIKVFSRTRGDIVATDDYVAFWKQKNGCAGERTIVNLPDSKKLDGTTVSIATYTDCEKDGALVLYRIDGGGHTWPGGKQYLGRRIIGNTSREINACDEIWKFFSALE